MLELRNVAKKYSIGQEIVALDNVSLKISEGEFLAIKGPSGCGKSTLLHVLGLLDEPDSGEYYLDGRRADQLSSKQRAKWRNQMFGFVFQSFNLLPRTSVLQNVVLPLTYRRESRRLRHELALKAIEEVGLSDRLKSRPNELSGGQQQRVAIARALVGKPKIILADEPTGNLDTKTGQEIMNLFKKIHQTGTTVVFVTHNDELLSLATRVITMRDGKILEDKKNAA